MNYRIHVFYSEEDAGYIAKAPALKGCSAFGETPEEALREIRTAMRLWLEAARHYGDPVPAPDAKPVARKRPVRRLARHAVAAL